MSAVEKMLLASGVVRSIYGRWRFQHLLSGIIVVVMLAVITAMLAGAMLIGALYAAYLTFLHYGWDTQAAVAFISVLFVLTTGLFAILTALYLRHLRAIPRQLLKKVPVTAHIDDAVDAFLDGLMTEEVH